MGGRPPERPVLFVNPRSGGGKAARVGLAGARARSGSARRARPGQDLAALVHEAIEAGADALGMAGGDGSLAVVAAAAERHGLPFVCVPAGTRNHFALDLGIARRDLRRARRVHRRRGARGRLGEVNGRVFVNNVSLGVYGDDVAGRTTGTRSSARCSRRHSRCSARAPGAAAASSSTTADASTARRC